MSIERRIERVEQEMGVGQEPIFYCVVEEGPDGKGNIVKRGPTDEAFEKAKKKAIEARPGQSFYFLSHFDDYCEEITPERQW